MTDNNIAEPSIITLQTHVLNDGATNGLAWIVSALAIAAKAISAKLKHARLEDVLGAVGNENVQGEEQQKLDVIANDISLTEHRHGDVDPGAGTSGVPQ